MLEVKFLEASCFLQTDSSVSRYSEVDEEKREETNKEEKKRGCSLKVTRCGLPVALRTLGRPIDLDAFAYDTHRGLRVRGCVRVGRDTCPQGAFSKVCTSF